MLYRFQFWRSPADNKWYWHLVAGNNEIVAQGQGYSRKRDLRRGLRRIRAKTVAALEQEVPYGRLMPSIPD